MTSHRPTLIVAKGKGSNFKERHPYLFGPGKETDPDCIRIRMVGPSGGNFYQHGVYTGNPEVDFVVFDSIARLTDQFDSEDYVFGHSDIGDMSQVEEERLLEKNMVLFAETYRQGVPYYWKIHTEKRGQLYGGWIENGVLVGQQKRGSHGHLEFSRRDPETGLVHQISTKTLYEIQRCEWAVGVRSSKGNGTKGVSGKFGIEQEGKVALWAKSRDENISILAKRINTDGVASVLQSGDLVLNLTTKRGRVLKQPSITFLNGEKETTWRIGTMAAGLCPGSEAVLDALAGLDFCKELIDGLRAKPKAKRKQKSETQTEKTPEIAMTKEEIKIATSIAGATANLAGTVAGHLGADPKTEGEKKFYTGLRTAASLTGTGVQVAAAVSAWGLGFGKTKRVLPNLPPTPPTNPTTPPDSTPAHGIVGPNPVTDKKELIPPPPILKPAKQPQAQVSILPKPKETPKL